MIIKQKLYNNPELERSYVPYEEQKNRNSRINRATGIGIGSSVLAGGTYYGLRKARINRDTRIAKDAATEMANTEWRNANSNWLKRGWSKVTGKKGRIERNLQETMGTLGRNANARSWRAGKWGLGIAATGTALTLGARSIMKRRANQQKYYDQPPQKTYSSVDEERLVRSKNLPDSRIGIGWISDKNGKSDSESYLRSAKRAADKSWKSGDSEEKVIKKSKRAAGRESLLDSSGKPLIKSALVGGGVYATSKLLPVKDLVNLTENTVGIKFTPELKDKVYKVGKNFKKHGGKVALGTGALVLAPSVPKVYKKVRAARMGAEINTRNRINKYNKENDSTEK